MIAPSNLRIACLLTLAVSCCVCSDHALAEQAYWELAPYRIQALIALDVPGGLNEQLAAELPMYLTDRARAAFGSAWRFEPQILSGPLRHRLLRHIDSLTEQQLPHLPPGTDKCLLLAVRATPTGYELVGREYDFYVQRWSEGIRRQCRQRSALPEQLFQLARETVGTLAQLRLDPDDDQRVILVPRGVDLPHRSVDLQWIQAAEVLVPIWRRTTREGEVVQDGIQQVPWTYLEAEDVSGREVVARIYSGTRRPLGVRHRGRIEQLAISLPVGRSETTVQLRSRTDQEKPLVGYEVYVQNTGEKTTKPLGYSDQEGQVVVGSDKTRVQLLYVKSGGNILARVPVVPGSEPLVRVPLPDDDLRLEVESRLAALREDLIDVVARRNILMARVRQEMDEENYGQARQLMGQLDQLPDRAFFNRALSMESRLHHSDDPSVQKRIEELFAATQVVLAEFLDVRPIGDLNDELRARQQQGS
jgi:hypothetical protein